MPMRDGITHLAVDAVFRQPHFLLVPAAAWSAIGLVLLRWRRNRAFGLAGGVSVAAGIGWVVLWLITILSADATVSAQLLGLQLELLGMFWFNVLLGVIVSISVVAGLVAGTV